MDGEVGSGLFEAIAILLALIVLAPQVIEWLMGKLYPSARVAIEEAAKENLSAFQAASTGNLPKLEEWLEKGIDIDSRDLYGLTLLHHAAMKRQEQTLELLLKKGASVDLAFIGKDDEASALQIAARTKWRVGVELLLRCGAQLKPEAAMLLGNESFFCTYLDDGGDPNLLDGDISLLGMAAKHGKTEIAHLLLEAGADVNIGDPRFGITPLHYASQDNVELAQVLLEWGADIERVDDCGSRPLHFAAYAGAVDVIEILLDSGANIEADSNRRTPLEDAVKKKHLGAVEVLLQKRAGQWSSSSLASAIRRARDPAIRELLERYKAKHS